MTLNVEEKNFDSIIIEKILPVLTRTRSRLITTEDFV
jgi:hypothetical protein